MFSIRYKFGVIHFPFFIVDKSLYREKVFAFYGESKCFMYEVGYFQSFGNKI